MKCNQTLLVKRCNLDEKCCLKIKELINKKYLIEEFFIPFEEDKTHDCLVQLIMF